MDLVLTPVVEFEPGAYATSERSWPRASSAEEPDAWDAYWRASLADAGVVDLEPFEKASWLVPVERLVDEHVLDAMLRVQLDGAREWSSEIFGAIQGGYVLSAGQAHLWPGCCGDLSNLADWSATAEHRSTDWAMVWIGHPWTHVSANQDLLTILEPSERDTPLEPTAFCSVSREVLARAIELASQTVAAFEERLRPRMGGFSSVRSVE